MKGVILEKQVGTIAVKGQLTLTKTLGDFLNPTAKKTPQRKEVEPETLPEPTPFRQRNIQMAPLGCVRNGNNLDCRVQITSINLDDQFHLKSDKTRLLDAAGKSYYASNLSLLGNKSTVHKSPGR